MSAAAGAAWCATRPARRPGDRRRRCPQSRPLGSEAVEADRALADLAEVRHCDYRDVDESGFDAVSSIGLTEHIGVKNYPSYFAFLSPKLRTGGLLLNHCITRNNNKPNFRRAVSSTAMSSRTAS